MGSAEAFARFAGDRKFDRFTPNEAAFIAARDSFYIASVSQTGWPYVQHRGGPAGFLKVINAKTLAYADYRGNRQYISVGNLRGDGRVALILMDHAARARLEVYAHAAKRCSTPIRPRRERGRRRRLQGETGAHLAPAPCGIRTGTARSSRSAQSTREELAEAMASGGGTLWKRLKRRTRSFARRSRASAEAECRFLQLIGRLVPARAEAHHLVLLAVGCWSSGVRRRCSACRRRSRP
jgi:hypothetical protein